MGQQSFCTENVAKAVPDPAVRGHGCDCSVVIPQSDSFRFGLGYPVHKLFGYVLVDCGRSARTQDFFLNVVSCNTKGEHYKNKYSTRPLTHGQKIGTVDLINMHSVWTSVLWEMTAFRPWRVS